ncbi:MULTISPECIES: hypothetical protein [Brevibacillus]|uniref:Uncharacterized protein n=1 Tax=Brevibacillus laterosporus TaxID=1465 RepID=A0AAP8QDH2_BRELA|nr:MULTISPECIES: hypothetical protein [Brevibacillus]MCG7319069.1 hypothetical protein [Brevibacillus laterosporus]MED1663684.1 hypothetical protein [Brevibacillus laterosporus]MED1671385.1 hypothetical protein [Brevibacillus laterosporus]MED1719135.1 hypothetical protein [Brevibacillus laterosporus]MED1786912.1 hypothetical protein [Brevibacillus laterosporus]
MATVIAHTTQALTLETIIGLQVRYQKHRPGAFLSVEEMPKGAFPIESVHQFGKHMVINDGLIMMESAPTVIIRNGRIAFLLPTGEELYLLIQ